MILLQGFILHILDAKNIRSVVMRIYQTSAYSAWPSRAAYCIHPQISFYPIGRSGKFSYNSPISLQLKSHKSSRHTTYVVYNSMSADLTRYKRIDLIAVNKLPILLASSVSIFLVASPMLTMNLRFTFLSSEVPLAALAKKPVSHSQSSTAQWLCNQ